jgi:ParB-like chromosome segregation protein Spo0J
MIFSSINRQYNPQLIRSCHLYMDDYPSSPLQGMKDNIKERGLQNPLVVHQTVPGAYRIQVGRNRYLVLIELGATQIDCIVAKDFEEANRIGKELRGYDDFQGT